MSPRAWQHQLEYVLYRLASAVLLRLPLPWVRAVGRGVGRVYGRLALGRRGLVLDNLSRALPELSSRARRRVAGRCFAHYGATFFETFALARFSPETVAARFEVDGWEHLEAVEAADTGYFLYSAHYGAWDLAVHPIAQRFGTLHLVARPLANPKIWAAVQALRESWGNTIIPRHGAGHRMLNAVRKGGRVALQIDQRVRPRNGVLTTFFDRPAWTTPVLAYLSCHTGAPVVPVVCSPTSGGRYRLRIEAAIWPDGKGAAAEERLTESYLAVIERWIRQEPSLWMWMHRRWRLTRPVRGEDERRRLREASGVEDRSPSTGGSEPVVSRLATTASLETCYLVVLDGDVESAEATAMALAERVLGGGHGVRVAGASTLAAEQVQAEASGRAVEHRRKLDLFPLLVVDARTSLAGPERAALARVLGARWRRRALVIFGLEDPATWADVLPTLPKPSSHRPAELDGNRAELISVDP